MRLLGFLISGIVGFATPSYAQDVQDIGAHLLHALDYLRVDYPSTVNDGKVVNPSEYHEQQEFAEQANKLVRRLPPTTAQSELISRADALVLSIQQRRPGAEVAQITRDLTQKILAQYHITVTPALPPNLTLGAKLFAENCIACHGAMGFGDGPKAAELSPKPANFHATERQYQRNIYSLYNTISLGVAETEMRAFTQLNFDERWALAYYVSNFAFNDEQRVKGAELWKNADYQREFNTLERVTLTTPAAVQTRHGDAGLAVLAHLRAHPELIATTVPLSRLEFARQRLRKALAAAQQGDYESGYQFAASAYLEGFELVESTLNARNHVLKLNIEQEMTAIRSMLKNRAAAGEIETRVARAETLFTQANALLADNKAASWVNASGAFIILLREGLEAILVLAAIFAFISRSAHPSSTRYVHAGWVLALLLGVLTWWIASQFIVITGENREFVEGLIGLIAAAMLIYVGYWLHNQTHAHQWQSYIREKLGRSGSVWTLVSVSFLAVYREVFETVLFYETMWLQTDADGQPYIILGFAAAAVVLVILGWAVFRFSVRLPLKLFFSVNSVLLYGLAVVLTGKGIAALQEAGTLPVNSIDIPTIDLLGIYPTIQGVALQISLVLGAWIWLTVNKARRAKG
ncbi:MAG: cytochrome c/FTR1 family iron permease [Pseudomonadota bacterium]